MKLNIISTFVLALLLTVFFNACSDDQPTSPIQQDGTTLEKAGLDKPMMICSSGTDHGYFWSLCYDGGSASISFPNAGTYPGNFAITYSNVSYVFGGKGWSTGAARTIGYHVGYLSGSYNFVGIHGWVTNPLIEYYIAEMGSVTGGTFVNSVYSDGHSYSFYKQLRVNAPSIIGTATFWQYKDTWGGSSTGSNCAVTMSNHVNNWSNYGGQGFGSSYNYQKLVLEASGSGSINATVWSQ
ncbi:MAG: glycoside hydrolase family 11 protein [Ignavibacteria bacterium]|jgi:endo-1,4-beta-xylanase